MSDSKNKETFSKNLQYFLNLNNKTQTEVCRDLKISNTTFSEWVRGTAYPRIDKIERLANYFGISKSDLIEEKDAAIKAVDYKKRIPILGRIAAGQPVLAVENIDGYEYVEDESIDYALKVRGDSMVGAGIFDGYTVYVSRTAEVVNGNIVIALINGYDATVKRFYRYGDEIVLRPENPTQEEQHYKASEVKLLGRVIEAKFKIK